MAAQEVVERVRPDRPFPIITYNLPYEEACARHIRTSLLGRSKPFIIISRSLSRETDAVERLTNALNKNSSQVAGVHKGMQPHTLFSEVLQIIKEVKDSGADSIITVGGGSLVDGAKTITFAIANDADTHEKLDALLKAAEPAPRGDNHAADHPEFKPSTIPIMSVTTTLSAGEHNPHGGATNDRTKFKQLFEDPSGIGPRVIVLDPKLTVTAPERVWLSTGMRAVDHCVESVCSSHPHPEGTKAALKGLSLLIPALLRSKEDPKDLDARLKAQLGAAESLKAYVQYGVPLGGSHGIGHQLGPYGVPHAETTCVCLPAVQKYNAKTNGERQQVMLKALWNDPVVSKVLKQHGLEEGKADLGDALDAVIRALGLPRKLREYEISPENLDAIAESSLKDGCCKRNPVPLVEKGQVLEILQACLD